LSELSRKPVRGLLSCPFFAQVHYGKITPTFPLEKWHNKTMYRYALNKLILWKKSSHRKPLVLEGARQVGKTWLLKEFGKSEHSKQNLERL